MKIRITMKDPDAVWNELHEANADRKFTRKEMKNIEQWFEYSEYLTVEIDTETGEAEVVRP